MKPLLFFLLLAGPAGFSAAQKVPVVIHLTPPPKLKGVSALPFDKVVVIDKRFDTAHPGTFGFVDQYIFKFDQPLPRVVEAYMDSAAAAVPHREGTLYVSINRFAIVNAPFEIDLIADAFLPSGDSGFRKVASIDSHFLADGRSGYKILVTRASERALNALLQRIAGDGLAGMPRYYYARSTVYAPITRSWLRYPVMAATGFPSAGVYQTWSNFRSNLLDTGDYPLTMTPDSSYFFGYPMPVAERHFKGIYAVCYNGLLYYNLFDQYLLPLVKTNGTFSFYVPSSLSALLPEPLPPFDAFQALDPQYPDPVDMAPMPSKPALPSTAERGLQTYREKKLAGMKGKTCFIDMDTGQIVY
ncbi:hypothetical protein [Dinghuibacter silviterrae]|uniref:WG repeat protein n=1 Tax=Dinghuibacter silviterrae TaxID=1539049 RepID=A0A4R8DJ38_9BACT|nr:hypothetical protein [Dinghuibacter silviterrae]TDW97196.1 hypothetical protein EDB95_5041 [Dinghuibacter silviterrae]